ncbi:hypothetical protein [Chryseobacterium sp. 2987]|uniref:hypothetical protein n=1 Tax=Chryseobacterium sp. 2987 TaxID=2817767 RepID=UPI00285965E5|nr:hypothetical protein [Chryseobacterium sp. 2987]MDR6919698.1 alpha-tubulin suppressor-like RCC1 family protein [Chryseobacterium sp. 2987]
MKKSRFFNLFVPILLFFSAYLSGQNITLLGKTSVTAKGSGATGNPVALNWNIPAGKNRVMIITYWFERDHRAGADGSNYPSGNSGFDYIPPTIGGVSMAGKNATLTYFRNDAVTATAANAHFSTIMHRYVFTETQGLPTGSTAIAFPDINTPKNAGDEVAVHIEVYGNVSDANTYTATGGNFWGSGNTNTTTYSYSGIPTATQTGRSNSDIMYLAFAGMTKDETYTVSPSSWINTTDVSVTNTEGNGGFTATNAPQNEPDGIRSSTWYFTGSTAAPSMTLTRASNNRIATVRLNFLSLLPLAKPSVTGTVYKDTDGYTNINGTVTNAGGLYVNAVGSDGRLVYSASVNTSGVFTIPAGYVTEGSTYTLQLSKNTGTIGAVAPLQELPEGWLTVGEATSSTGNDGTPDGRIVLSVGYNAITGLRYGINDAAVCFSSSSYSNSGWKAVVYDAPAGIDGWTQVSGSNSFPTSSYAQIATFDYNVNANTNNAFTVNFQTGTIGLTPSNPQISNYVGTRIPYSTNEDYAVIFNKTIKSGEEGLYKFDLTYGDDHIFIYKNGVKINQQKDAFNVVPVNDFATLRLNIGDVISILMVEEWVYNTAVTMAATRFTVPPVQNISNICPDNFVNLNTAFTGTVPSGGALVWFTNSSHAGTPLNSAQVQYAGAGTYYAFYYNSSTGCYSLASNPVTVTINSCPVVNNCITGDCNSNTFLNTSNPDTIEYDNFISGFHSSTIKKADGTYMIWGQNAQPGSAGGNITSPLAINPVNGFNYTGKILKTTIGTKGVSGSDADQYALLSEDGLYVWGGPNVLVNSAVKSDRIFGKITNATVGNANTYGLPSGVTPTDVKMLFGSYATLAITTCTGEAYVLSWTGAKNGDGTDDTGANSSSWHRVMLNSSTTLNGVVAMRGTRTAMMALTRSGKLYTWGSKSYLGNGTDKADRVYATEMTLPSGVIPKMIGMTLYKNTPTDNSSTVLENSYYLLSTAGKLYSLGNNTYKQLGTFDAVEKKSWVSVKSTSASVDLANVAWISPNEHDNAGYAANQALTTDGKLWSWGYNAGSMLGGSTNNAAMDPVLMTGGLSSTDKILAVETGGHTNMVFKACSNTLGYIGHSANGSMGIVDSNNYATFQFSQTPSFNNLCSIELPPVAPVVRNLKMCSGNTATLNDALEDAVPTGYSVQWWTTPNRTAGTQVTNPAAAGPGTYYAFYIADAGTCTAVTGSPVVVSYYTASDPEFINCICFKDPIIAGNAPDTMIGITLLKRAGSSDTDNWPTVRKSGHIALESNTQGLVITRISKANLGIISIPQEGMMVYDTTDKCLKIYSDGAWKCFSTPACP